MTDAITMETDNTGGREMAENAALTDEDFAFAEKHEALGPAYSMAKRITQEGMKAFEAEHLAPLVDEAAKQFRSKLWESVEDWLWCDTEMNLQGKMYHAVDDCVKALLSGERWALNRYVLGERYDHETIRKAVAATIPDELRDARIKDLEKEVEKLTEQVKWLAR